MHNILNKYIFIAILGKKTTFFRQRIYLKIDFLMFQQVFAQKTLAKVCLFQYFHTLQKLEKSKTGNNVNFRVAQHSIQSVSLALLTGCS